MKISYNRLKEYLDFSLTPKETAAALTSIGLESDGIEEIESVRGGLRGLVVGHVLTCIPHPDSDHLHVTTVDPGFEPFLQIVCGAPNVSAGQKVIVATVGTKLYDGDKEFIIKKTKIRGIESTGMICAEDEIGVGTSHEGIIVLPSETPVGTAAAEYYRVESDTILEVDITPNRIDAASHFGVARDLAAFLKINSKETPDLSLKKPSVESFSIDRSSPFVTVRVENAEACPRYSGLTIRGVRTAASPAWLKFRLESTGIRSINNIVDVTNYIMQETGQPLHAFDLQEIKGNMITVKTLPKSTKFITLDDKERTLSDRDLMICNHETGMCIGGVFGGQRSGVKDTTTDIFLESAYFNPTWIRKTARRHGLNTDASFRFERGTDPNNTVYTLKRAAILIKELAGGEITGEIQDVYPSPVKNAKVELTKEKVWKLSGKQIPVETIETILNSLEIKILDKNEERWTLDIPAYRVDVTRDVDVIEDILRIYGYNNIETSSSLKSNLSYQTPTDISYKQQNTISEQLAGSGYNEILNNSLTSSAYYEPFTAVYPVASCVRLANPQSAELNVMRQTLLFGGLENIQYNRNHKNPDLHFYEFGNIYIFNPDKANDSDKFAAITEEFHLAVWLTGYNSVSAVNSWIHPQEKTSVFELKATVENILLRLGLTSNKLVFKHFNSEIYSSALSIETLSGKKLGSLGTLAKPLLKQFDIAAEIFFAELNWNQLMNERKTMKVHQHSIPRFPAVRRDLALLIDKSVSFAEIERVAFQTDKKILKEVILFDVYEGKNLPEGKKSYAVCFTLQDEEKTLNDKQIELLMARIQKNLEDRVGAELR